ncbi:hypothetical protein [Wolbachia pipientis]|nr:hypothetical protein [Wolbachia pipientis]
MNILEMIGLTEPPCGTPLSLATLLHPSCGLEVSEKARKIG